MLHIHHRCYACVFVYYVDGIVRLIVKRRLAVEGCGRYPPTESGLRGRYAVFLGRKTINNTKRKRTRKQNRHVLWPSQTMPNDNCINRANIIDFTADYIDRDVPPPKVRRRRTDAPRVMAIVVIVPQRRFTTVTQSESGKDVYCYNKK